MVSNFVKMPYTKCSLGVVKYGLSYQGSFSKKKGANLYGT